MVVLNVFIALIACVSLVLATFVTHNTTGIILNVLILAIAILGIARARRLPRA